MKYRRIGATVFAVTLFFVWVRPGSSQEATPPPQVEELRVLLNKLSADNAKLTTELEQREAVIKLLTENLAIARTESDLFQKKWAEAQLRAQSLGVDFRDTKTTQSDRQLVESVRALYLAQAERQRLTEQMQRLVSTLETNGDVAGEIGHTKALLATGERTLALDSDAAMTIHAARVLDVNDRLRLLVLNVGDLQGVRVGMPFAVFRGDRQIALVKVVEVRRRICGTLVERVEKGYVVVAGDTARVVKSL